MVSQMMLLLQLEMQLRQQAMIGYVQATNPTLRVQHLDEVLALNEQLNEVGSILGHILQDPRNQRDLNRSPNNHSTFRNSDSSNLPTIEVTTNNSLPILDSPRTNINEFVENNQNTPDSISNNQSIPRDNRNNLISQTIQPSPISNTVNNLSYYNNSRINGLSDNSSVTTNSSNHQSSRTHLPPINNNVVSPRILIPTPSDNGSFHYPDSHNEDIGDYVLLHTENNTENSQSNDIFESQSFRQDSQNENSPNEQFTNSNEMVNTSYHYANNNINNNRHSDIEINAIETNMSVSPSRQVTTTRTYSAQRHVSRPSRRDQSVILHARRLSHSTVPHHTNTRLNESQTVNQHIHTLRRNVSIRNRQQSEMCRSSTIQNSTTGSGSIYRPRRRSEIRDQMLNLNSLQMKKK